MPARPRSKASSPDATELVRQLGTLLNELQLTEAEVTVGNVRARVQRTPPPVITAPAAPAAAPAAAAAGLPDQVVIVERPGNLATIEAPMVGTFYRASSPTAEPYVREGDMVKEGQIVCIIEAMKLMNEIEAKVAGKVAKILTDNGQPVEFGQPLFLIEPSR
jgi:acetyl-CoA carboxylase biotin carboxyl carrier protein